MQQTATISLSVIILLLESTGVLFFPILFFCESWRVRRETAKRQDFIESSIFFRPTYGLDLILKFATGFFPTVFSGPKVGSTPRGVQSQRDVELGNMPGSPGHERCLLPIYLRSPPCLIPVPFVIATHEAETRHGQYSRMGRGSSFFLNFMKLIILVVMSNTGSTHMVLSLDTRAVSMAILHRTS